MEIPSWLLRLENRFGHWGVPHAIRGLVLLNCLSFVLQMVSPGFGDTLLLSPSAVMHGEFWRMFTFLFFPAFSPGNFGMLFFLLSMYFTWFIGEGLEQAWGAFLLNFYLVVSVVCLTLAGILLSWPSYLPSTFIMASLLFSFATIYPDLPIMIFPLPIQIPIKYVALFSAALICLQAVMDLQIAVITLSSLSSFFLFTGPGALARWKLRLDSKRRMKKFRGDDT